MERDQLSPPIQKTIYRLHTMPAHKPAENERNNVNRFNTTEIKMLPVTVQILLVYNRHMNGKVFKQKSIWLPFILILTLLQFGCVSNSYWTWEHNELNNSQLANNRQECRQLARIEADNHDFFYSYRNDPFYWPYNPRKHFNEPYWSWYRHNRFIRYQENLDRYFYICMKAKGWERVQKIKKDKMESKSQ